MGELSLDKNAKKQLNSTIFEILNGQILNFE